MEIGRSVSRVDAYDKVTGRAKFTLDLLPKDHLVAKVVRSTIASGKVLSIDTSEAEKVPGVVGIFTCFDEDLPTFQYYTAGHPWDCNDATRGDIMDRKMLDAHVRQYGDNIAAVVAEDSLTAEKAVRLIKVEYEEYPIIFDYDQAVNPPAGAPPIHEEFPDNIQADWDTQTDLAGTGYGSMDEIHSDPDLHHLEITCRTPRQQHAHIETCLSYCYMEGPRIVCVTSTQIPNTVRMGIGQALEIPWGMVRVIKPCVGGGFGNKQDILYEPLNAWLCKKLGGRCVLLELTREEVFAYTRSRQPKRFEAKATWDDDMNLVARSCEGYSNSGGYASHGQAIVANGQGSFRYMYSGKEKACFTKALTFYSNQSTAGAMRAYGVPESTWAAECIMSDIAHDMGWDGVDFRLNNAIQLGYTDPFWPAPLECISNGIPECLEKGKELIGWDEKKKLYANETGPVRHGLGVALLCYKTSVAGLALESASARMVLNEDGSVMLDLGATEIGQGCDTVMSQMAADAVGVPMDMVHIISTNDTDTSPYGAGAFASRQTLVTGFAIKDVATKLREKIFDHANVLMPDAQNLDLRDGWIIGGPDPENPQRLMSLGELSCQCYYSRTDVDQISAVGSIETDLNSFCLGACFVEVEVDIPMCRAQVINAVEVHDSGRIINPATAAGQVHGGMAQSIGFGLFEELIEDPKTGKTLNDNMLDYKIPTFMDIPDLTAEFVETWDANGPFGNKSLGEPPCIPAAPAIRDAILDATGVKFYQAPITPQRLFEGFKEAGLV